MGAPASVYSGSTSRRQTQATQGFTADIERDLWIARSGAAWRDLTERYGAWQTIYKRFVQRQIAGLLEKIFHDLGEDADLQDISIDGTYIDAHKASTRAKKRKR